MLKYESEESTDNDICIYITSVDIADLNILIEEIESIVCDLSWINQLDERVRKCYQSCSTATVNKIKAILSSVKEKINIGYSLNDLDGIRKEFGEYAVSYCALNVLKDVYNATPLPLTEIVKEKKSSNPGFDFHAYRKDNVVVFGESKYDKFGTGRTEAIKQIDLFLCDDKTYREIMHLRDFVPDEAIYNINFNNICVAAAYTTNKGSGKEEIDKILSSSAYGSLRNKALNGLYIIAINEDGYF